MNLELVHSYRLIFFKFYGGAFSTRGPDTCLQIRFNKGISPFCFLEFMFQSLSIFP